MPERYKLLFRIGGWLLAGWTLAGMAFGLLLLQAAYAPGMALEQSATAVPPPRDLDVTPAFEAMIVGGRLDPAMVDRRFSAVAPGLQDVRFLLMPSYLDDLLDVPHATGLMATFDGAVESLRAAGHDARVVDTESEASVAHNARLLAAEVAAAPGRVCILSHSKGGLDTLEFLLHADDATLDRIACWVAFVAPFAGTPVADEVAAHGLLRWPSEQVLAALGGSGRSLHDQRTDTRAAYLARHDPEIAALVARIPIVTVAGALDGRVVTPFAPTGLWMEAGGIRNDGMVPTLSALLPNARHVVVAGMDHMGSWAGLEANQEALLTRAMLGLALAED